MGINKVPCTSKACEWNKTCVKKIEPALVAETSFYTEDEASKKRKRKAPIPKASLSQQQQFLTMLADRSPDTVVLNSFKDFSRPFKKPWCFSQHEVTEEEIENVERATIHQASCVQWHQERVGRITGSIAHRVLTATEHPSKSLINTICEQRHRPIMKPWIQWGRHHEQDAIDTYQYTLGAGSPTANLSSTIYICAPVDAPHQNLVIRKAGFRICQTMPYLGVSCDGYVSCDCCGEGVIEAKCPYRWGQDTSTGYQQWLEDKRGHLESLTSLKRSHAYFTQVFQYFTCIYLHTSNKSATFCAIIQDNYPQMAYCL